MYDGNCEGVKTERQTGQCNLGILGGDNAKGRLLILILSTARTAFQLRKNIEVLRPLPCQDWWQSPICLYPSSSSLVLPVCSSPALSFKTQHESMFHTVSLVKRKNPLTFLHLRCSELCTVGILSRRRGLMLLWFLPARFFWVEVVRSELLAGRVEGDYTVFCFV